MTLIRKQPKSSTRPAGCLTLTEAAKEAEFSPITLKDRIDTALADTSLDILYPMLAAAYVKEVKGKRIRHYLRADLFRLWRDAYLKKENVQLAREFGAAFPPGMKMVKVVSDTDADKTATILKAIINSDGYALIAIQGRI